MVASATACGLHDGRESQRLWRRCAADARRLGPDGRRAFVTSTSKRSTFILIDSSGNSLGPIAGKNEAVLGWMPDSAHVIVMRTVAPRSWRDYAQVLGPDRAKAVARDASALAWYIRNYHGDSRNFGSSAPLEAMIATWYADDTLESVDYYLAQTQPRLWAHAWNELMKGAKPEERKSYKSADLPNIIELRVRQVSPRSDELLMRSPDPIDGASASPSGRAIALQVSTKDANGDSSSAILVVGLYPNAHQVPVEEHAKNPAWSPDGQYLAFLTTSSDTQYFHINSRRVCDPSGNVFGQPEATEKLAAAYGATLPTGLAWLPDGRILFQSASLTLPTTTLNLITSLFTLRPGSNPTIAPLVADESRSKMPDDAEAIAVSPDGKRAAILGAHGAVSVLAFDSGEATTLQAEMPGVRSFDVTIPSWRSNDELSYVVAPGDSAGSPNRAELVIGNLLGKKRAISKSWHDVDFLPMPTPQPSASPTSAPQAEPSPKTKATRAGGAP